MNERILIEIANLRHLRNVGIDTDRVSYCLEILRYIRNSELNIGYEEGVEEEDRWIAVNRSGRKE